MFWVYTVLTLSRYTLYKGVYSVLKVYGVNTVKVYMHIVKSVYGILKNTLKVYYV